MNKLLVLFIALLVNITLLLSQTIRPSGEEELFNKKSSKSSISFDAHFLMNTMDVGYSDILYSKVEDEWGDIGISLGGNIYIAEKFKLLLSIPVLAKCGTQNNSNLPGLMGEFKTNIGFSDISLYVEHNLFNEVKDKLNVVEGLGLILPTGQSKNDKSYKGYLPLGNGFTAIDMTLGCSKTLNDAFSVFSDLNYTIRLSRKFEYESYYGNSTYEVKPGNVFNFHCGIGFYMTLFGEEHRLDLEFAYFIQSSSTTIEPEMKILRIGFSLTSIIDGHSASSVYVGIELPKTTKEGYLPDNRLVGKLYIPFTIKQFNF